MCKANIKIDLREVFQYIDKPCSEARVKWWVSVFAVLNLRVLLTESYNESRVNVKLLIRRRELILFTPEM
jgi:hypothetical protein